MIKLQKLPERIPVKMSIQISPELADALQKYAAAYEQAYGKAETVGDLIPFMLAAFLESDRGFCKAIRK